MAARNVSARTHRITLKDFDGSDDWFDILDVFPYKDRVEINDQVMKARQPDNEDQTFTFGTNGARYEQLARALRNWNFTRDNGRSEEVPWSLPADVAGRRAVLDELDGQLGNWMALQADLHYGRSRIAPADPTNGTAGSSASPPSTPDDGKEAPTPTAGDAGPSF